jgi:hypothetical protein
MLVGAYGKNPAGIGWPLTSAGVVVLPVAGSAVGAPVGTELAVGVGAAAPNWMLVATKLQVAHRARYWTYDPAATNVPPMLGVPLTIAFVKSSRVPPPLTERIVVLIPVIVPLRAGAVVGTSVGFTVGVGVGGSVGFVVGTGVGDGATIGVTVKPFVVVVIVLGPAGTKTWATTIAATMRRWFMLASRGRPHARG